MINSVNALSGDAVSLVQKLLERADLNGDGDVTTKEFSALLNDAIAHPPAGADAAARASEAQGDLDRARPFDLSPIDVLPGSGKDIVASLAAYVKSHE
jgi:hypothetical protein